MTAAMAALVVASAVTAAMGLEAVMADGAEVMAATEMAGLEMVAVFCLEAMAMMARLEMMTMPGLEVVAAMRAEMVMLLLRRLYRRGRRVLLGAMALVAGADTAVAHGGGTAGRARRNADPRIGVSEGVKHSEYDERKARNKLNTGRLHNLLP
ncbi:MAG: hypothetical protein AB7H77_08285 [Bdellovibrionales bacterium]